MRIRVSSEASNPKDNSVISRSEIISVVGIVSRSHSRWKHTPAQKHNDAGKTFARSFCSKAFLAVTPGYITGKDSCLMQFVDSECNTR